MGLWGTSLWFWSACPWLTKPHGHPISAQALMSGPGGAKFEPKVSWVSKCYISPCLFKDRVYLYKGWATFEIIMSLNQPALLLGVWCRWAPFWGRCCWKSTHSQCLLLPCSHTLWVSERGQGSMRVCCWGHWDSAWDLWQHPQTIQFPNPRTSHSSNVPKHKKTNFLSIKPFELELKIF